MKTYYLKFNGKHPAESKDNRNPLDKPPEVGDYGAAYSPEYLKVDIDDYNHKTGELEFPIRGKPRSDVVIAILDALKIKYNCILTEKGKHLFFRIPEQLKESKNKSSRWLCPLGIKMEWKFPTSDDHIPLRINGVERKFLKGSIDNEDVDELPYFLYPLQMDNASFKVEFPEGDRTQHLGGGIFSTLWFQSLDKELTTKNKDILIQMLSAWIGEIGEIDRTFKANKSDVKNFMTLTKDSIRKPYAREPITKARSTSFCGTTNKDEFLNDDTGFRRWWVIPVNQKIDMGNFTLPDNLHQFWAQCYAAVCENPQCFRLTGEERQQLEERNKEVMEMLPAEDELRLRFDLDAPIEKWNWVQPSVLKNLPDYDVSYYSAKEIGAAIRAIMKDVPEIQHKHSNRGTIYLIPPSINNTDRYRNK